MKEKYNMGGFVTNQIDNNKDRLTTRGINADVSNLRKLGVRGGQKQRMQWDQVSVTLLERCSLWNCPS